MQDGFEARKQVLDGRINLLSPSDNQQPHGRKIFRVSRFILYLLIIMTIAFFIFSYQVIFTGNSISEVFNGKINILKQLSSLALDGNNLKGETDDRINILLLGMGGAGHEGPYLTDTVIVASVKPSTQKMALISIPRDLLVNIPAFGWWKINNANAFGEQKEFGSGPMLASQTLEKTLDIPIQYYVRVDFSSFEKIIDDLGGLKINVERAFTDFQYPTADFKYQVVSFEAGLQTMDGDTALKFARSRHGNNGEGSDFARSKRQQKILEAFKERVLSYSFFLSPRKISKLSNTLSDNFKTNMEPWEAIVLAKLIEKVDAKNIITKVLDDSESGLLYANIVNEAYVLQPKGDDFNQIQYLVKNVFQSEQIIAENKPITVEIRNGTEISGLASRHSQELKLLGFRVLKIGNAPEQNKTATQIFKISTREQKDQVQLLEKKYQSTMLSGNEIPDWIMSEATPDLDFFIVLGANAEEE
ncbi:LCP family protein [Candidatus Falkowbacteria bacterium]|nr:LCP family protein [Candidatus Falkowbacteria bacterium]